MESRQFLGIQNSSLCAQDIGVDECFSVFRQGTRAKSMFQESHTHYIVINTRLQCFLVNRRLFLFITFFCGNLSFKEAAPELWLLIFRTSVDIYLCFTDHTG